MSFNYRSMRTRLRNTDTQVPLTGNVNSTEVTTRWREASGKGWVGGGGKRLRAEGLERVGGSVPGP
jgi:hypothetical protein